MKYHIYLQPPSIYLYHNHVCKIPTPSILRHTMNVANTPMMHPEEEYAYIEIHATTEKLKQQLRTVIANFQLCTRIGTDSTNKTYFDPNRVTPPMLTMLGKRYYREANRYVTPLLNSGFVVDHLLINATPIAQEYVKCAHLYCSIATILINGSMLVTKIGGCEMVHGTASTQHTVAIESLYSYMIQQNPDTIIERCTSANYVPTCNE